MLLSVLILALQSVRRNLLRSFLTILGIVIGVSAVITMVTLGNGATQAIQTQISSLGSNLLMVMPGQRQPGGGGGGGGGVPQFTEADGLAIQSQIGGVAAVAPQGRASVTVVANGRTPLQILADEFAASSNAAAASTNMISTVTMNGNLTMKKEAKKFYLVNPNGKTRAMVLPGVENKKCLFIANVDQANGGKIVIKIGKWAYVFIWQGAFMVLGLFSMFIVLHYWRMEEKLRAAGLGSE